MGLPLLPLTSSPSFRTKIFGMAAVIIVTISCAFTIFFITHGRNEQKTEMGRQGELLAALLATSLRLPVFAADTAAIGETAEGVIATQRDVTSIAVYSSSGDLLISRSKSGTGPLPPKKIDIPPAEGETPLRVEHPDVIEVIAPIQALRTGPSAGMLFYGDGNETPALLGSVRLELDKSALEERLQRLIWLAGLCMTAFLLLGAGSAYLIARQMTQPLTSLMEGVNILGSGVYQRIAPRGEDEIGRLAHAFNGMVENLERRDREKRQLEEQLRLAQQMKAKEEWERTFDTVPDLIAILDREQRIVRINRAMAEHLGVGKDEAAGRHCSELCPGCSSVYQEYERQTSKSAVQTEMRDEERDRWYWVTLTPLSGNSRDMTELVYVARDISVRKKAEAEKRAMQAKLIQTNKMASLGLLVSGMAHEVNNPNSNIIFTAHLVAKAWQDAGAVLDRYYEEEGDFRIGGHYYSQIRETLPQHIAGITDNARRIEGIIKNLKDFVRKGKADLGSEVDINSAISVAASLIGNQIKRHTDAFTLRLTDHLPRVKGNPQQLEQVFINLILNAVQALPGKKAGVTVATSLDAGNERIRVTIADEGCGMHPDVKANIFEPFFSTKLDYGGTGLGLAISKSILDEHGASIEIDSEPGKGTVVSILLPVSHQKKKPEASEMKGPA
ncbi:PAS domain-containing sensor histidine kinase [Geobacter sp. DSM 9736]|uniref:sensor histidine kinase n=1 Tax=Geobacter sp. DSM 9736 TaxID=1277350 RepID=UPI000B4FF952|nr:ATP-binding protein [Geobacter sp. DSM 9736]SNB48108.1 PAS domain S-box-containing protein [Geobacter sp. DSM 9736]